ncbi:MAG: hypothetical protein UU08_C0006G0031 [Candidatus Uhrbacteria bacterium GW2011_GWE2_40_58]|nr:MAG: hypothetical protein UT94_C0007G0018 [Candidatus Uhrbacteria bacterium GW2011_GWF2_40_263]KKR67913.1 MAG: hypothetical protein UU08_C0006G0031 [Candidatus Uhrbacteria bacterium GW2011_GWE2_40_58]OGL92512.1 MAG: hypothetical protein A2239_01725 [Candidatus Uhrbacteria bacterium RIFOXYA2_FULL_40_9]HCB55874.1 hypothetical protein [Candidatus Uhrbacteria bacterium]
MKIGDRISGVLTIVFEALELDGEAGALTIGFSDNFGIAQAMAHQKKSHVPLVEHLAIRTDEGLYFLVDGIKMHPVTVRTIRDKMVTEQIFSTLSAEQAESLRRVGVHP